MVLHNSIDIQSQIQDWHQHRKLHCKPYISNKYPNFKAVNTIEALLAESKLAFWHLTCNPANTAVSYSLYACQIMGPSVTCKPTEVNALSKMSRGYCKPFLVMSPMANCTNSSQTFTPKTVTVVWNLSYFILKTRLRRLDANISPDKPSLTPQAFTGYFLQHPFCVIHNYYKLFFIFFLVKPFFSSFFFLGGGGGGGSI